MSLSKPLAALAAAARAAAASPPPRRPPRAPAAPRTRARRAKASKRALVRATLCVLNAHRARHDLRPLRLNRRLSRAARRHSRAMARRHFFSHDSLSGASFVDRIRRTGYLSGARSWSVGENIAYGTGSRSTPRVDQPGLDEQPRRTGRTSCRARSARSGSASPAARPAAVAAAPTRPTSAAAPNAGSGHRGQLDALLDEVRARGCPRSGRARPPRPLAARPATARCPPQAPGSAPPIVSPPSKRSNTRGSMYDARQTAGVLPR